MYEEIIFLQGEEANEALQILEDKGEEGLLKHLMQWHYPGEHETCEGNPSGNADNEFDDNNYKLSYNEGLGYVGLAYKLED